MDILEQVEMVSESFSIFSPAIILGNTPAPNIVRHQRAVEFQKWEGF